MSIKIQYASDLHIEFPENKEFLKENPLKPTGDILVLAGDIVPFSAMGKHKDFFSSMANDFETIYWIPGNHEYYYGDLAERTGTLNEKLRSNLFLVNNTSVVHMGVRLIFSTLWSKISPSYQWQIEKRLNDFHLIKNKGYRLSAERYNQLHVESLSFINQVLEDEKDEKTAVFTHHAPTFMNYPELYKGDILNEAFAIELYDMIVTSNIDSWVYGHLHSNTPEFTIGKTKLLTNQLGYVQLGEHSLFETTKHVVF